MDAKNKEAVKAFRRQCENSLELSAYVFRDRENQARGRILTDIGKAGFDFQV